MIKAQKLCFLRNITPFRVLFPVCSRLYSARNKIAYENVSNVSIIVIADFVFSYNKPLSSSLVRTFCDKSNFVPGIQPREIPECWNCASQSQEVKFFCDRCGVIQKPIRHRNHFEIFGIQPSFNIDELELAKLFRKIQMVLHPDKFSLKSEKEQEIAAEYSALVNRAYSTIRNPWERAKYLLKTLGIVLDETTSMDNPNFLMKIMERNELVDDAENPSDLENVAKENEEDIGRVINEISANFNDKKLEQLKKNVIELKYYANIAGKISEKKFQWESN